jgi:glycine hydroxymethyltransferase
MHVIAAKAVALKVAMQPEFKTYQGQGGKECCRPGGEFIKLGFKYVSGGTDITDALDLMRTDVTGKDGQIWLDDAWITVTKTTVPNETRCPFVTSGIR